MEPPGSDGSAQLVHRMVAGHTSPNEDASASAARVEDDVAQASTAAVQGSANSAQFKSVPVPDRQNQSGEVFERHLREQQPQLASRLPAVHINDLTVGQLCNVYSGPELSVLCGFHILKKKAKFLLAARFLALLRGGEDAVQPAKVGTVP